MDRRIGPALKAKNGNDVEGSTGLVRAAARDLVKLFRSLKAAKQYRGADEAISFVPRKHPETGDWYQHSPINQ